MPASSKRKMKAVLRKPIVSGITRRMRRISQDAGGGKVTLSLNDDRVHAHVYRSADQVRLMVIARLKSEAGSGDGSFGVDTIARITFEEGAKAIVHGAGRTVEDALSVLADELAVYLGAVRRDAKADA